MIQSQTMMTYTEYKRLRSEGKILAGVSNSDAIHLIGYLPKRFQYAHLFWSWIWMLSIPGFIAVSIFYKWWIGVLLLFIVTPMISRAIKKSAAEFVLEHAEGDAEFFNYLLEKNLLILKQQA